MPAVTNAVLFNDTAKPTVSSTAYSPDGGLFTVKFNEPILTAGTIQVYDENNNVVADETDFSAVAGTGSTSITLDTTATTPALTANKTYKVVMVGATDLAGNFFANNRVEASFKIEKTDTVAPAVSSVAVVNSKTVRVTFSEPVQVNASTGKVSDLSVDGGAVAAGLVVVDGTPTADGQATEVTAGTVFDVLLDTTPLAPGAHTITLNNFKDIQGNAVSTAVTKAFQVNTDTTAANLTKTEAANGKVVLTFDEEVVVGAASGTLTTPDNVQLAVGAGAFAPVAGKPNQIEVNLTGVVASPIAGTYTLKVNSGSVNDTASTPNTKEYTTTFALTTDSTKPALKTSMGGGEVAVQTVDNDHVVITYTEAMGASALDPNNYLVDGQKVFEQGVFTTLAKDTVSLPIKAGAFDITGSRVLTIENVTDVAGNTIEKVTRAAETYKENVKPTIVSAELLGLNKVVVTFSEAVTGVTAAGAGDDFEVYTDGATTANAITGVAAQGTSTKVYEITFTTNVADLSKPVTLKVLSGNNVTDTPALNKLSTTGNVNVTH